MKSYTFHVGLFSTCLLQGNVTPGQAQSDAFASYFSDHRTKDVDTCNMHALLSICAATLQMNLSSSWLASICVLVCVCCTTWRRISEAPIPILPAAEIETKVSHDKIRDPGYWTN